jgi:hypothetical protein
MEYKERYTKVQLFVYAFAIESKGLTNISSNISFRRILRILTTVYNTQNHWACGLSP